MARSANRSPGGYLDTVTCDGVPLHACGWACDIDSFMTSLWVHFYVDGPYAQGGTFIGSILAELNRPDVGFVCGNVTKHGFNWPIPVAGLASGPHTLYAYAIDPLGGPASLLQQVPMTFVVP